MRARTRRLPKSLLSRLLAEPSKFSPTLRDACSQAFARGRAPRVEGSHEHSLVDIQYDLEPILQLYKGRPAHSRSFVLVPRAPHELGVRLRLWHLRSGDGVIVSCRDGRHSLGRVRLLGSVSELACD